MANSIGQLLVELGVNTAAFKAGLDKATYEAKAFAKDVKSSFGELGGQLRELASEFGGVGGQLIGSFGKVSEVVGPLVESFGSLGGAVAGVAAAFAAVGVAGIGAAVHFSETAERLNQLSQSTGISIESLSQLGNIASTKGIDVESMAKAIEKMDKAALQAAQSGPKAHNAFRDLGVAVTDANGNMREAKEIFDDVAARFATMPDGPQKTAEAIAIFGRAGANMIPLLNEGGAGLRELNEHFEKLNAVVGTDTAKASEEFNDELKVLGGAFTGIENQLTKDLVPALQVVAEQFVSFFEDNQDGVQTFADGVANVSKVVLNVFQELGLVFSLIYRAFYTAVDELQVFGRTVAAVWDDIKSGNFSNIGKDVTNGLKEGWSEFTYNVDEAKKSILSTVDAMVRVNEATLKPHKKEHGEEKVDINRGADLTFIDKEVAALERQAAKEEELAQAVGKVSQATIDATAKAQAHEAIQKLVDEATQKGIQNSKEFKDALAAAIPKIQDASLWFAAFKAAIDAQAQYDKFTQNLNRQVAALEEQARAGTEVEKTWAKNNATLVPLKESLDALSSEYDALAAKYGEHDKRVTDLAAKVASLRAQYELAAAGVGRLNVAFQQSKANDEVKKLDTAIAQISSTIQNMKSGDGFLDVNLQIDLLRKNVGLTEQQLDALRAKMEQLRGLQIQQALAQKEASLGYDQKQLNNISALIQQLKKDWQDGTIGEQEYQTVLRQLNKEQADLEAKTVGFASGIKAALADFAADTKVSGQLMHDVIGKGLQGLEDNFAQMVATGKASWSSLISDMETMLLKSAIHNILNSLFGKLGGLFGGGGGEGGGGFFGSIFGSFGGGKAIGGGVQPGTTYLVGEKGPELFTPNSAGTIIPNGQMAGGGASVVQNWNISTPDADSFRRSKSQIQGEMYRASAQANARHAQ